MVKTHQLSSQKGHVLNDCQSYSPFGILSQLNNSWKQRLGKLADSNHLIHTVQVGDDVEANLWTLQEGHDKNCNIPDNMKKKEPIQLSD